MLHPVITLRRNLRLRTGCATLDFALGGGIPRYALTEIAGSAGAGKTQLLLGLCLTAQLPEEEGGLDSGVVYISTEGRIPLSRLKEMLDEREEELRGRLGDALGRVYVRTVNDAHELWEVLNSDATVKLLQSGLAKLVIIDSIAAVFRGEFVEYRSTESGTNLDADVVADAMAAKQRSETMRMDRNDWLFGIAALMKKMSFEYDCMFVVANQVSMEPGMQGPKPALGLVWSTCVNQRFFLDFAEPPTEDGLANEDENLDECEYNSMCGGVRMLRSRKRLLSVHFSPDLRDGPVCKYVVNTSGVCAVDDETVVAKDED